VFGSLGLELDESDVRQTMGLRIDDAVRHWWDRSPWEGAPEAEVAQRIVARVVELIAERGVPSRSLSVSASGSVSRCARAPTAW
jgi:hypothetical protein